MLKRLDKLEIIDVLTFRYLNDPTIRAIDYGIPRFINSKGYKSPFGTAMIINFDYYSIIGTPITVLRVYRQSNPRDVTNLRMMPEGLIRPGFQGHEVQFWVDLEKFHDTNAFFSSDGVSMLGEGYLQNLKDKWKPYKDPI